DWPAEDLWQAYIQLTEAGETLLPLAESGVELELRIRDEVADQKNKQRRFALGVINGLSDLVLPSGAVQLSEASFDSIPTFLAQSDSSLVRSLLERTLDLGIVLDAPKVEEILVRIIGEVCLVPVISKSTAVKPESSLHRYIHMDWGKAFNQKLKDQRVGFKPELVTNVPSVAVNSVINDGGWTYVPLPLLAQHEEQLVVEESLPEVVCPVYGCFLAASSRTQKIERALSLLAACIANLSRKES
ncbi:MAG: LysR substrate-binding domain-containing protein, partial [Oceanobacter sp.]